MADVRPIHPDDGVQGPAPEPKEAGDEVDYRRYLDVIRKRIWLLVVGLIAGGSLATLYTLRQPKEYAASSVLIIDTNTAKVLTQVAEVMPVHQGWYATEAFYQKEYEVLRSRAVARRAGQKLGILSDDAITGLDKIEDPLEREKKRAELDPASFVMGHYRIEPGVSPNLVTIRAEGLQPRATADLANAVADAYVELNLEKRVEGTEEAAVWLGIQHGELKSKLEKSESALYVFMEQNNVLNASLESQLWEVKQRLQRFNDALADVQARAIAEQVKMDVLFKVTDQPELIATIPQVREAPVVSQLKAHLVSLRAARTEMAAKRQPAHPEMRALDEQVAFVEKSLKGEIHDVLESLKREVESIRAEEAGLQRAIALERSREAKLNKLGLDFRRLTREVETNERLYEMVTKRKKEADLTGALRSNNVSVLERARVPGAAFKPSLRSNLAAGIVFGLLLALALAFGLDLLDNTIKHQEDVEQLLRVPFLGLLPLIDHADEKRMVQAGHSRGRDFYVLDNPKSSAAECARFIRTNLLFMSPDKPLRTMLVTSAGPQEGKTTTAISLAVTMAQSGSKTLLVDTDMRRPRLHRSFDLPNTVGLCSIIVGDTSIEDAVRKTRAENLDVLVCGPIPPNPAELLHTHRFENTVDQLLERYDRIIFDSPPVGAVTDPVVLGAMCEGTLLVVKCNQTSREAAKQMVRTLRDARVNIFGAVLNDVDLERKRYGSYYYQYYRRYGYYYGTGSDEAEGGTDEPKPEVAA